MFKWKKIKGKMKTSLKAYKYGLFNARKLIKFMKIAPMDIDETKIPQISSLEVKKELDEQSIQIIDIRSVKDFEGAHIEGSRQMDLFSILDRLEEIPRDKKLGIICYGGGASQTVTQILLDNGFENVKNITGGIIRYALDVDDNLLGQL